MVEIEPLCQEEVDLSSLRNFPNVFAYGLTMVMGAPFTGEKGGNDFLSKALQITDKIENVLNEPAHNTRGHYAVCYQKYHMHATVGAVRGSWYENPNQPLLSLKPAEIPEMLTALREAQQFCIKLQCIKINSQGEILVMGKTCGGESGKTLERLRIKLKNKANFQIKRHNIKNEVHITLGYLKEIPPVQKMDELKKMLEELLSSWRGRRDYFAAIEISKVKLIHYAHRSIRTIAGQIEFELGKESGYAHQIDKVTAHTERKSLQYTPQHIEEILIKRTQRDLQESLKEWVEDKMRLWRQLHGEDNRYRINLLLELAKKHGLTEDEARYMEKVLKEYANTYPLTIPAKVQSQIELQCGAEILADITADGITLDIPEKLPRKTKSLLNRIQKKLQSLEHYQPPLWRLVITTQDLTETCVAAVNLGRKISPDYPENTVFINPYFFNVSDTRQVEILYHTLISYITKGITEKREADIDTFINMCILHKIPLEKAAKEARLILHGQNRHLYYGSNYVAVSAATKDEALKCDKKNTKKPFVNGIAVGLGDSGGDLPFLELDFEGDPVYLPFFVGEQSLSKEQAHKILQTKEKGIAGSKAVLELMLKAHNKKTEKWFYCSLNKLIENTALIPSSNSPDTTFELAVVYTDKDDTLTAAHEKITPEIATTVANLLLEGVRIVLITSNDPQEVMPHFIDPVHTIMKKMSNDYERNEALLQLECYFYNSLGHLHYDQNQQIFVKDIIGATLSDVTKIIMFKIYIKLFLDFLRNPETIIRDKNLVRNLKEIYDELHCKDIDTLLYSDNYKQMCKKFDKLVSLYQEILGMPRTRSSVNNRDNIYIRTWGDAFVTVETGEAAAFLHGAFPAYVYTGAKRILTKIYEEYVRTQ